MDYLNHQEIKKPLKYKVNKTRIAIDFLYDILQARKGWNDVLKVLNKNKFQPGVHFLEKLSQSIDGGIRTFIDEQELAVLATTIQFSKY